MKKQIEELECSFQDVDLNLALCSLVARVK